MIKTCKLSSCGKEFEVTRNSRRKLYCSIVCRKLFLLDSKFKNYKNNCGNIDCNNKFIITSKNQHKKYCSKICSGQHIAKTVLSKARIGLPAPEGSVRCRWYEYDSPIAGKVRLQGTWKLRFANCLDAIGKNWRTNHGLDKFNYLDKNGNCRTYNPDFYSNGEYLEVKGYFDEEARWKMEKIIESGINVRMIYWEDLKQLEIDLFGKQLSGVNTSIKIVDKL